MELWTEEVFEDVTTELVIELETKLVDKDVVVELRVDEDFKIEIIELDDDFELLELKELELDGDVQSIELKLIDWVVVGVPNPNILSRFPVTSSLTVVEIVKLLAVLRNC
jgi:phospholipid N-methyltransferase